jgi:hypothetical protein
MKITLTLSAIIATLAVIGSAHAQSSVPVTVQNFVRAETDMYFGGFVKNDAFGKFSHSREPANIDKQDIIRMNRDTLYSQALFDLDAGPVTITVPNAGKRFMSVMIVDQDHYVPVVYYGAGSYTLTRQQIGTRYVGVVVRTLVDPADPKDVQQVHALQDALKASQKGVGKFEVPSWDPASQKKVRDALLVLNSMSSDFKNAFGARGKVDPIKHLIGTASGWGGNPDKDAAYAALIAPKNDGATIYRVNVKNVPVDGFWSVSVYNAEGYFEKNPYNAYSINNITAKKDADGSVTIQFGGCDGKISNCIPVTKGWNAAVRLYRPRAEILNGKWKFPEAQAVN